MGWPKRSDARRRQRRRYIYSRFILKHLSFAICQVLRRSEVVRAGHSETRRPPSNSLRPAVLGPIRRGGQHAVASWPVRCRDGREDARRVGCCWERRALNVKHNTPRRQQWGRSVTRRVLWRWPSGRSCRVPANYPGDGRVLLSLYEQSTEAAPFTCGGGSGV